MKLFNSVNRKIKFREEDYVEKNYIREDGKAVIPIYLEQMDDLYMQHDYKRLVLSDSICDYIEEIASIIPFKYDIVLEFHCHQISKEEQDRIRGIIKNNCGMEIDDLDYESRMSRYISILLFLIGTLIFFLAYAIKAQFLEILKEYLIVIAWVIIWRMTESILFTSNERKIKRLNKLQLYDSKVEFIFDKNENEK